MLDSMNGWVGREMEEEEGGEPACTEPRKWVGGVGGWCGWVDWVGGWVGGWVFYLSMKPSIEPACIEPRSSL